MYIKHTQKIRIVEGRDGWITSWKKSSPLSLWATEMNFSKLRDLILLINLSWVFFITSHIPGAVLRVSGVVSRYNCAALSAELDISL
jgi:hypothetical protein